MILHLVYFEFGFESYKNCKDIYCEHLQICFNILYHLNFIYFLKYEVSDIRYFPSAHASAPRPKGSKTNATTSSACKKKNL
jgi:hypothetical protein